jgi:ribosomal protein L24E
MHAVINNASKITPGKNIWKVYKRGVVFWFCRRRCQEPEVKQL